MLLFVDVGVLCKFYVAEINLIWGFVLIRTTVINVFFENKSGFDDGYQLDIQKNIEIIYGICRWWTFWRWQW